MMNPIRTRTIVELTAAALALGLALTGCGKSDSPAASSSTAASSSATSSVTATSSDTSAASTPAAAPNYESLLMKPEDLPQVSTGPWTADAPKVTLTPPPPDVSQTYSSGTNAINASVIVAEDATAATTVLGGAAGSVPSQVTGTPVRVPSVTPDASLTIGTSLDGTSAMAALVFSVDNTVAVIVFGSAPGDLTPIPQDFAEAVGKAQVAAIQAGQPGLK
jgi:hypothetical protein